MFSIVPDDFASRKDKKYLFMRSNGYDGILFFVKVIILVLREQLLNISNGFVFACK